MTLLEIIGLALVALVVYLIATHKIHAADLRARFEGIGAQLGLVHQAAQAPVSVVNAPPAGPVAVVPAPAPVAVAPATPAPAPAPAPVAVVPAPTPPAPAEPAPAAPARAYGGDLDHPGTWRLHQGGTVVYKLPGVTAGAHLEVSIASGYEAATIILRTPSGDVIGRGDFVAGAGSVRATAPVDGDYSAEVLAARDSTVNHWRS